MSAICGLAAAGIAIGVHWSASQAVSSGGGGANAPSVVVELPDWAIFADDQGDTHSPWSYNRKADNGPQYWGTIRNASTGALLFPSCAGGPRAAQSPIDIEDRYALALYNATNTTIPILRNYSSAESTLWEIEPRPGGHPGFHMKPVDHQPGSELGSDAASSLQSPWMVDGVPHYLTEMHFHSPSDHVINGKRYVLEAHILHQSIAGELAGLSILYDLNEEDQEPNRFLHSFWDSIHSPVATEMHGVQVDMQGLTDDITGVVYRYNGSLTVPPCTEGIKWHITVSKSGINAGQMISYKYLMQFIDNYRDAQPTYGRSIQRFNAALPSIRSF